VANGEAEILLRHNWSRLFRNTNYYNNANDTAIQLPEWKFCHVAIGSADLVLQRPERRVHFTLVNNDNNDAAIDDNHTSIDVDENGNTSNDDDGDCDNNHAAVDVEGDKGAATVIDDNGDHDDNDASDYNKHFTDDNDDNGDNDVEGDNGAATVIDDNGDNDDNHASDYNKHFAHDIDDNGDNDDNDDNDANDNDAVDASTDNQGDHDNDLDNHLTRHDHDDLRSELLRHGFTGNASPWSRWIRCSSWHNHGAVQSVV